MKKSFTLLLYCLLLVSGRLHAFGERVLLLGAGAGWAAAEKRSGINEIASVRPHPVLALSSVRPAGGGEVLVDPALGGEPWYAAASPAVLDMALSFDEARPEAFNDGAGHYRIEAAPALAAADRRLARLGHGAVLFSGRGDGSLTAVPRSGRALFAPDQHIRDFTLEFWLYPMNMENGEQILAWSAVRSLGRGKEAVGRILCSADRSRLRWNFQDFFVSPGGASSINLSLSSSSTVIPKTWSHHLIRFDASLGLLEYLVNGKAESLLYATSSGGEGGDVFTPVIGRDSRFVLGPRFTGLMDEFKIHSVYVESPSLRKYRPGGRIETKIMDLGEAETQVLKVEASGGRTQARRSPRERPLRNEYAGFGNFKFADNSALQFFIRASDNPYSWTEADWRSFEPGSELGDLQGRFVQIAAVFYPSGDGETTPYLDELRILYAPNNPPHPPSQISAAARDGAVDLSWRASPDEDTAGYLVYYGEAPGDYFGTGAVLGASPVNAGKRTSIRIDGLKNGTLYYFAVAAYDKLSPLHAGEFSREVSARPLRMLP